MISRKNRVVETMKRGISLLLQGQNVDVVRGTGSFWTRRRSKSLRMGRPETFKAEHIVIATGSRVASIPAVKVDGEHILSSDEVMNLKEIPRDILIIGGGVVGVEFATIFNGLGSKVTILEMLPKIISTEDEEVIRGLHLLLEKTGNHIFTQARVMDASPARRGFK